MDNRPPKAQPQVAVDIVVFTIQDRVLNTLLIEREREPFKGTFSLPGGFLWQDETTAQAAKRVLKAKANVRNLFIEQLYTFDDPKRDSRGHIISVTYFALVPFTELSQKQLSVNTVLRPVDAAKNLPFDHGSILSYAVRRLRTKLGYSNVAYSLLPDLFTLSQLQEVYEVILGHDVDKRNFRKKILSLDLIEPTEQKLTGQRNRPARLFKFKKHSYDELENPIF